MFIKSGNIMSERVEIIDKYNLDECCIQQPQLFQDAADEASERAEERDLAKVDMDTTYAELDGEIRKGDKKTEKEIESLINSDDMYIEAKKNYVEARKLASLADNLKTAYEQRKSMLEYTIRLFLSEYYSDVDSKPDNLSRSIGASKIKKELYKKEK